MGASVLIRTTSTTLAAGFHMHPLLVIPTDCDLSLSGPQITIISESAPKKQVKAPTLLLPFPFLCLILRPPGGRAYS